ncbi:MAG: hypothetical protein JFR38_05415 [Muribaculaceae bacterium]|nr:hypothetical protein [Muribaculaceae bacterium]
MHTFLRIAACALTALASICASAQDKPAWATKGTDKLNASRSNDSYELRSFNTHDVDKTRLQGRRFEPLTEYVREHCNAHIDGISIDSIATPDGLAYVVAYSDATDGSRHSLQAIRIDEYSEFDDYDSNDFQWELYQLYAIGRPDTTPVFDEFELTRSYRGKALAMSIIPGWGQIYKGQTAKGCVIIGLEAVSIATAILGEHKRSYMMDEANNNPALYDSWKGKANSWRNVRNVAIGVGVATYIYNLIDAATSKGARRVFVHKRPGEGMAFTPAMWTDGAGMTFTYTF